MVAARRACRTARSPWGEGWRQPGGATWMPSDTHWARLAQCSFVEPGAIGAQDQFVNVVEVDHLHPGRVLEAEGRPGPGIGLVEDVEVRLPMQLGPGTGQVGSWVGPETLLRPLGEPALAEHLLPTEAGSAYP